MNFDRWHDEIEQSLEDGEIDAKEANRQHQEVESERADYYGLTD